MMLMVCDGLKSMEMFPNDFIEMGSKKPSSNNLDKLHRLGI